jgi:esterase
VSGSAAAPRINDLDVNSLRLRTYEWGDSTKPPLLLLHGLTSDGQVWADWAHRWSSDFHVVAYDQRGHGASEHASPGVFESYNVNQLPADIGGVADAFGFTSFSVLGHSMGGRPIIAYATVAPERLTSAVIVDIGPEMDRAGGRSVRNNAKASVSDPADPNEPAAPAPPVAVTYDPTLLEVIGPKSLVEIEPLWAALPALGCPTLVVRGETSNILSPAIAKRMVDELPDGEFAEVAGAGHGVPTDSPAEFERVVLDFLTRRVLAHQGGVADRPARNT